ncbi:5-formyltetrahydrofolate cyclo-ligase [Alloprevotella sp. OH1205_COT-284]|uniref:5-formyltetrahydrofolate cyclo-ligase n=1 Tax=Alloprevotella sp. OH1205_COT-284 TaxID=2491043 RepID=UPI000F5EF1DF|nr:5-formyltetrahydrofolate cyclo-ligase [Alloprevotella sp. OH1205_COT-284]RRD80657.1 5-formyltetrahydrofolate cyclo-ligase [Alloprevotella sp. OH1205_COT-284]
METKEELRQLIGQRKQSYLSETRKKTAADRLLKILRKRDDFLQAETILLYAALPDEVPTQHLWEEWQDKRLLLPTISEKQMFVRELDVSFSLQVGKFGIFEPVGNNFTSLEKIDIALVPGIAFDKQFHRCGRGKGYYDTFFSHPQLGRLKKVGLCFDFQIVENVPIESHDHILDDLIIV